MYKKDLALNDPQCYKTQPKTRTCHKLLFTTYIYLLKWVIHHGPARTFKALNREFLIVFFHFNWVSNFPFQAWRLSSSPFLCSMDFIWPVASWQVHWCLPSCQTLPFEEDWHHWDKGKTLINIFKHEKKNNTTFRLKDGRLSCLEKSILPPF